jgi:hypothetical protein
MVLCRSLHDDPVIGARALPPHASHALSDAVRALSDAVHALSDAVHALSDAVHALPDAVHVCSHRTEHIETAFCPSLPPISRSALLRCVHSCSLEYDVLATRLKHVLEADPTAFNAERLVTVTPADVKAWFGDSDMPNLVRARLFLVCVCVCVWGGGHCVCALVFCVLYGCIGVLCVACVGGCVCPRALPFWKVLHGPPAPSPPSPPSRVAAVWCGVCGVVRCRRNAPQRCGRWAPACRCTTAAGR